MSNYPDWDEVPEDDLPEGFFGGNTPAEPMMTVAEANRVLADERASFKAGLDLLTIELDDMTSHRDHLRDVSDATILRLTAELDKTRDLLDVYRELTVASEAWWNAVMDGGQDALRPRKYAAECRVAELEREA